MKEILSICLGLFLLSCSHSSGNNKRSSFEIKVVLTKTETLCDTSKIVQQKTIPAPSFALTYWQNDTLFLFGKFEPEKTITLINNKDRMLFETKTKSIITTKSDIMGEIWLTRIATQPKIEKCKSFDYCLFSEKPSDYSVINPMENLNIPIEKIDSLIRKTNLLDLLLEKSGQKQSMEYSIGRSLPSISTFNINNSFLTIVSYRYFDSPNGPRIVYYKDNLFPLTGQCSFNYIFIYRLNSKYFIQTGSSCCGCGYIVFQVFEITNQSIELIYNDDSFAN
jgi:hypothetical protein